jgi:hypothetical protein
MLAVQLREARLTLLVAARTEQTDQFELLCEIAYDEVRRQVAEFDERTPYGHVAPRSPPAEVPQYESGRHPLLRDFGQFLVFVEQVA